MTGHGGLTECRCILTTVIYEIVYFTSYSIIAIRKLRDELDHSMREVVVYARRQLLKHRALLLPNVYSLLCQKTNDTLKPHNLESSLKVSNIISTRWVLSSLTAALQGHIMYHCTIRKYGTLTYR